MLGYRQTIAIGMGQRPDPDLFAARKALTWRERLRVGSLVRRGEAAWDVPSARYAAAFARSAMRQPMIYGRRGTQVSVGILAVLLLGYAVGSIVNGPDLRSIYLSVVAIWITVAAFRFPPLVRNAPRALERNEALLGDDRVVAEPPVFTRLQIVVSMIVTAIYLGVVFGLLTAWLNDEESVGGVVFQSVFFGVGMVLLMRWAARRKERQEGNGGEAGPRGTPPIEFRKPG